MPQKTELFYFSGVLLLGSYYAFLQSLIIVKKGRKMKSTPNLVSPVLTLLSKLFGGGSIVVKKRALSFKMFFCFGMGFFPHAVSVLQSLV